MIKSMTGFGASNRELPTKKIYVEIKALNSKQSDVITRISSIYREKEIELRNEVATRLLRGKIDLFITTEPVIPDKSTLLNIPVIENYFTQLKNIANIYNLGNNTDFLRIILSLPDAIRTEQPQLDENEWIMVTEAVNSAINAVDEFRLQEGKILEDDIRKHASIILNLLQQVDLFEDSRTDRIKKRIRESVEEITGKDGIDENRFEQELIYYIEKLDFTEEKVRLKNHIDYFFETLNDDDAVGKKLGFITQEMGREINTLGSKANDSEIQKIVIKMKDELEKIKEQTLNIL